MTANLLSRLEGLTWPDREVDGLVEIRFGLMPEDAVFARENVFGQEVNQWHTGGFGSYQFHYPEEYTASLDAVVALCERVLPGWDWGRDDNRRMYLYPPHTDDCLSARGPTPAIALLIAILTALEARDAG